jgi:hypothetical protein
MDETLPEFEIGQLSGLDKSEMNEIEDLIDLMDSGVLDTNNETIRLSRLLSKANAGGGSTNSIFSTSIIRAWQEYRFSEAYDHEIYFTDYSKFREWWRAVNRKSQGGVPHNQSLLDMQASGDTHKTTGGKTITPELQRRIDEQYKDDHYPVEQEEQSPPDLSTTANGGETDPRTNPNGRKRTHGMAFNASTRKPSPVMAEPSSPRRRAKDLEELWEKIMVNMTELAVLWRKFSRITTKSVDPPVRGYKVLDMMDVIKPTSFPGCVHRLMTPTAFSAEGVRVCLDNALDAVDYDIAETLSKASRAIGIHFRQADDAHDDDPSPNEAQKNAGEKCLDEAKRCLLMLEQMTKGDAMAKKVMAQMVLNPDAALEQLIQLSIANGGLINTEVVMQYLKAAQTLRASDTLENFLTKVRPMIEALVSAFAEMEKLE